ncbi:DUF2130 domain-containing protein [Pedobacter chitinilyticus]|uniref:DUF2130 domain-containing protein n=1 Tax=Pedobacter chitinilyticus TaxID=2233776 RepID=A0A3S3SQF4_9SPHI|nr:DUF2130 domain-containing protein [Pedobacter chitinilyticus]RWU05595.1 DUF2130 domain-containing protein [Pedobacter chitinilyticus]
MSTEIKCPNCNHAFPIEEVMAEEYKKELREQMASFKKKQQEEFDKKAQSLELQKKQQEELFEAQKKQQELAFEQRLIKEKETLQASVSENLRKSISADFENQLKVLDHANKENEEKLKAARQKELEYLQLANEMKRKEEEMELTIQKKMAEEREKMAVDIRAIENQRLQNAEHEFKLKLAEKEKQLEDQKKLAEEMKRKAEQGSMQLQGEIQELALEELLRSSFPFDLVQEVGKGVRGADCIQTVRNNFGQECGHIIYESKRTVAFANDWIEKLKADMRSQGAEIAVLVTQNMPKDMNCFGLKDGIWICTFNEVQALAAVLRDGILRLFNAAKSQENKGDKMHMLYDYLTSNEFSEQWKAIREGFLSMKLSIQKERDAMEKLWKAREKQLDKVLLNAAHVKGSIEGIAGSENIQLSLTDDEDLFLE